MYVTILFAVPLVYVSTQRHHIEDILAGSCIGITSSVICYLIFWYNPLSIASFTSERAGCAKLVYTSATETWPRGTDFELTRLEEEMEYV
jgi:hypothetical protein